MFFVEFNHHFHNLIKSRKSEFIVESSESARGLILFNTKISQFLQSKSISPPICSILTLIKSRLLAISPLGKVTYIGNSS